MRHCMVSFLAEKNCFSSLYILLNIVRGEITEFFSRVQRMSEKASANLSDVEEPRVQEGLDLDDLLPKIGEFGKYQKILFWCICLPACIPCGFCAFNQLFMADVPLHWCKIPLLMKLSQENRKRIGIPFEKDSNETFSRCYRYSVDWSHMDVEDIESFSPNQSWPVEPCIDGWEFDTSKVTSSIVIDFDLVCNRDIYPTIGLAALNLGGPFGVYFFGILNDRIGRKSSFFTCLATLITGGILTGTVANFWSWAGCRLFVGLTVPAVYQIPFIISLELVGPSYRSFVTVFTCLFYTLGLILLAGVTYLLRNWRLMAFATSAPFLLYFLYWFYLPESPRWLLAKGRFEEALTILENIARVNRKELPQSFKIKLKRSLLKRTKSEERRMEKGPNVGSLCFTPNMRLKTILITFNWFANEMVYVGLSYYSPALGSNEYLSFFLSAVVEIPSYFCCWLVMDCWGRRWPLCLCMVVSGMCCVATLFLPTSATEWTLVLYLISKSTISASFLIVYPFAGELYPTQMRGVGIGTSAYIGGLGLIIIPFITYLGKENLILPLLIMGIISVLGGLSTLRLPETLHQRLPQTVEEGEEFGKNWTMSDCLRCVPLRLKAESYEDLDCNRIEEEMELEPPLVRKASRLIRESSILETNTDPSGVMKMTYWF